MKKKIIGIFIIMLMISSTMTTIIYPETSKVQASDEEPQSVNLDFDWVWSQVENFSWVTNRTDWSGEYNIPKHISSETINQTFLYFKGHRHFLQIKALVHEWKTMRMFLKAYGIPLWTYKPPSTPKAHIRILTFPDMVYKFFHYPYSEDDYENTLYQYLFCHSFLIGWRVPSEICELTTNDVVINENGTGCIVITEVKKHRSQRTLFPGRQLLVSKTHKSFKNWIDYWRPKVANQHSKDAFYLQPDGRPLTVRHLGHKLSNYGKQIWKDFQPYDMRHWCAVSRLIEQKVSTDTFDVIPVKNWLGHEKIQTTMNYVHYAEQYYKQAPYDWVKRVLKFHEQAEEENTLKPTNSKNTLVSTGTSPREGSGPGRN